MKLIKSSFEILEQAPGLEGIYEAIERAGRTCYKSERPEGKTAKDFVDMLIKRGHLSPLEHGTVYLDIKVSTESAAVEIGNWSYLSNKYGENPYSKVKYFDDDKAAHYYVTTNMRVLYENDWLDDLKYICEPTEHHEKRVGVRVNCSIGISREWNRHRALATTEDMKSINGLEFSVCEQSTRYCNYSGDKFGNELTFVIPSWVETIKPGVYNKESVFPPMWGHDYWMEDIWFHNLCRVEEDYMDMVREYLIPQQAREVLPLSTATEVVYTGYIPDWSHFFGMRCDNAAHPDMRAIAIPLKEEFIKRNWL